MGRALSWPRVILWVAGLHIAFLGVWVWKALSIGIDQHDWYFIRQMGRLFLDGQWDQIYGVDHGGFFWRFPPYGLYLAAVLAWLPATAAYWVKVVFEVVATLLAVGLVRSILPDKAHGDVAAVVVLGSSFFATLVASGQNSGTLLLIIATGLWLVERRSARAGFATWGLLAIKPNLGVGFGLLALMRRRAGEVWAMAGVVGLVAASSLPMWRLWDDFAKATLRAEEIRGAYAAYKQVTVLGFMEGVGLPGSWVRVVWPVVTLALIAAAVRVWVSGVPLVRKVGTVVLVLVAANPYLSFYDGLLLVVPGLVWWGAARSYGDRRLWRSIGVCIAVVWIGQHVVWSYLQVPALPGIGLVDEDAAPFSVVGPVVAVWLVLEMLDTRKSLAEGRHSLRPQQQPAGGSPEWPSRVPPGFPGAAAEPAVEPEGAGKRIAALGRVGNVLGGPREPPGSVTSRPCGDT